ncbi:response regulator [bacterium]|nr:response regulator [bacterium]MBU1990948.1 response regulator [bacterium]
MQRVLIVDDEFLNRRLLSKILLKEGYEVLEANDGMDAIEILKIHNIDLILMDLMMPKMDGFEATKLIKSEKKLSAIPLIIMSAIADKSHIQRGLELGADEYLTKPFDLGKFVDTIKKYNDVKSL